MVAWGSMLSMSMLSRYRFLSPLVFLAALCHGVTLDRVEPGNWWAGMAQTRLQILLHGDGVGRLSPRIEAGGIRVDEVVRVENPDYLFLYLDLANAAAGTYGIDLLDGESVATRFDYVLREREAGSARRAGFDSSDVIYLITPDRFANGDPSNDEVEGYAEGIDRSDKSGRHGGDLQGVIDHLDYIADMGFTAIWLNPVMENNIERAYHGYATTDFYKVDPRFGSNGLYRELCRLAADRGIKVIQDMIPNHSGLPHWFVQDPPTKDWINFGGEFVATNHRRQTNQDIYASEHDKRLNADGWFVEEMPDLNQRNPLMADYLTQNAIWWVEYAGVGGIRVDTWPYPDKDFMARWTKAILDEYPDLNIVGEEWSLDVPIIAYWQRGKVNHDGYVSHVPGMMDFPLQDAVVRSLTDEPREYHEPLLAMYERLALDFMYPDPGNLVIFPDNHDMARFFTQVNEDIDLFRMGLVYFLTMRGIPQIYYGTEILMDSSEDPDDHGIIRTDFPGGWPGDPVSAFTGAGLTDAQLDARAFLRKLLNWRKGTEVIHSGRLMHFAPVDGVYVYFRYNDEDSVMVVLNHGHEAVEIGLQPFAERLDGFSKACNVLDGSVHDLAKSLPLEPRSATILQLER